MPVFIVSSSQLGAEEEDIRNPMSLMSGDNVRHYWDGDRRVGATLQDFMGMDYPAWDVWLLYGPGAVWGDPAPEPDWWEHQLSDLDRVHPERRLDAERFASKARELSSQPAR